MPLPFCSGQLSVCGFGSGQTSACSTRYNRGLTSLRVDSKFEQGLPFLFGSGLLFVRGFDSGGPFHWGALGAHAGADVRAVWAPALRRGIQHRHVSEALLMSSSRSSFTPLILVSKWSQGVRCLESETRAKLFSGRSKVRHVTMKECVVYLFIPRY